MLGSSSKRRTKRKKDKKKRSRSISGEESATYPPRDATITPVMSSQNSNHEVGSCHRCLFTFSFFFFFFFSLFFLKERPPDPVPSTSPAASANGEAVVDHNSPLVIELSSGALADLICSEKGLSGFAFDSSSAHFLLISNHLIGEAAVSEVRIACTGDKAGDFGLCTSLTGKFKGWFEPIPISSGRYSNCIALKIPFYYDSCCWRCDHMASLGGKASKHARRLEGPKLIIFRVIIELSSGVELSCVLAPHHSRKKMARRSKKNKVGKTGTEARDAKIKESLAALKPSLHPSFPLIGQDCYDDDIDWSLSNTGSFLDSIDQSSSDHHDISAFYPVDDDASIFWGHYSDNCF